MDVNEFDFELPEALIAQEPPPERGASRLLVLHRDGSLITHAHFADLGRFLQPGDLLVVNDTRVFPARLRGHRVPSGGAVECLLVRQVPTPKSEAPNPNEQVWEALVHPGQKLKPGAAMMFDRDGVRLQGEVLDRHFFGRRTVRLTVDEGDVRSAIERIGHIPLPPYIKRADRPSDRERYQTVYARDSGSIAAPTAGLHFTDALLAELASRGVARTSITLHVGYGTFKPVRVDRVEDHVVDPESFSVSGEAAAALTAAKREGRRIVAVGTTTVRALESLIIAADGSVAPASGETQAFIRPGHRFQLVDALLTNFHLPRSSLVMLVAAFAGRDNVLRAYREAIEHGYRFYSYGDAMLIL